MWKQKFCWPKDGYVIVYLRFENDQIMRLSAWDPLVPSCCTWNKVQTYSPSPLWYSFWLPRRLHFLTTDPLGSLCSSQVLPISLNTPRYIFCLLYLKLLCPRSSQSSLLSDHLNVKSPERICQNDQSKQIHPLIFFFLTPVQLNHPVYILHITYLLSEIIIFNYFLFVVSFTHWNVSSECSDLISYLSMQNISWHIVSAINDWRNEHVCWFEVRVLARGRLKWKEQMTEWELEL